MTVIARFLGDPRGYLVQDDDYLEKDPTRSAWVTAEVGGAKVAIDLSKAYLIEPVPR